MNEQRLFEEAEKFLVQIRKRTGTGSMLSDVFKRELIRCYAELIVFTCHSEEESEYLEQIWNHYLAELDMALVPFRDAEEYVHTSEEQLLYAIYGQEYINRRKRERNKSGK